MFVVDWVTEHRNYFAQRYKVDAISQLTLEQFRDLAKYALAQDLEELPQRIRQIDRIDL